MLNTYVIGGPIFQQTADITSNINLKPDSQNFSYLIISDWSTFAIISENIYGQQHYMNECHEPIWLFLKHESNSAAGTVAVIGFKHRFTENLITTTNPQLFSLQH